MAHTLQTRSRGMSCSWTVRLGRSDVAAEAASGVVTSPRAPRTALEFNEARPRLELPMTLHRLWPSLLIAAAAPAAAETLPTGEPVDEAVVIDLTPDGLDAVTSVIPELLPTGISIDPINEGYEGAFGECWLGGYELSLTNMWIGLSVDNAAFIPRDGYLEIDLDIGIAINEPSDTFELYTMLECIDDTCDGYVDAFTVSASTVVDLRIVTGEDGLPALDANVGSVSVDYDLRGEDINLDNCAIGTVEDVFNFLGLSLYDIILSFAGGFIDDAIAGFVPEIEALIEDAAGGIYIEEELELGDATANLLIYPEEIRIREEGLRFTMAGSVQAAEPADCIAQVDPGGSYYFASDTPAIGEGPGAHHAGVFVSDEFGNQALYELWRAGLLCQVVDSELTGGFNIDTNLLGLLTAEGFSELFPDPVPMLIVTRPDSPPELEFSGENDVAVNIQDLGLEFYADLDHRQARVVGVDLNTDIGLDLPFDATTGTIGLGLTISGDRVDAVVTHNDLAPDATAEIEDSLPGMFDALVGPIVAGLLGETSFPVPTLEGIGLTGLSVDAAGASADWLGIYASVGPVSYESAGCDEEGGGCELGCGTVGPSPGRLALLGLPLIVVAFRRRDPLDS